MNAREAFLQLVDQSNWPDDIQGDYFHGYNDAMQTVSSNHHGLLGRVGRKRIAGDRTEEEGEAQEQTSML